nr:MAG TPA: hypothetical protein [Caudoviricetes sp.]
MAEQLLTKLVCKIFDVSNSTLIYESDVTKEINGIILPKGVLVPNKEYRLEIYKNTTTDSSDFHMLLSGTFLTSAWKVETPVSLGWEAVTNKPSFDTLYIKQGELITYAKKDDLKTKADASDVLALNNVVNTFVSKVNTLPENMFNTGPVIKETEVNQFIVDRTYTKAIIDSKFANLNLPGGIDKFFTRAMLRDELRKLGLDMPYSAEELSTMGFRGHNKINILISLADLVGYMGARDLGIYTTKYGRLFVKYAETVNKPGTNIGLAASDKANWNMILASEDSCPDNSYNTLTPIPAGYQPKAGEFRAKFVNCTTYVNGALYWPPYLLSKVAKNPPRSDYTYYLDSLSAGTAYLNLVIECPDRIDKITLRGQYDRYAKSMGVSVGYDEETILPMTVQNRGTDYDKELKWIVPFAPDKQ